MQDELTLLTDRYPFLPGEEFVAAELEYLVRGFSRVHVLPTAAVYGVARPLPQNAVLREDAMARLAAARQRPRAWRAAASLADADGRRLWALALGHADLRRAMPAMVRWLPQRLRRTAQYIGHALMLRDALRACPMPPLAYSFWLQAGILGAQLAGHAPLAARAHGHDLYEARHADGYLPLIEHTERCLSRLFFISEHGLRHAARRFPGLSAGRFGLARLGVAAAPAPAQPSADGVLRLLSCARALPVKRIDLLVDALRQLHIPVLWTHVGAGPSLPALQAQAASLPAAVQVRWLGELPHAAVLALYGRDPVDLFVNTSASEGLPVSVMEALSFAVPVLAPNVGGMAELVGADTGCLLPAPPQAADIAQALLGMTRAPAAQWAAWRARAQHVWRERVNEAQQYPALVHALRELNHLPELPELSPAQPRVASV